MDKLFKALIAFSALTILFSTSLPENGNVIEIVNNNPEFSTEYISDFYTKKKWIEKIIDPVVKVDVVFQVENQIGVVASGTGFGVQYDSKNNKSYIITNAHICKITEELPIPVSFYFESSETVMSETNITLTGKLDPLMIDSEKDLCLMIGEGYIKPVIIANPEYEVRQMERVKIIGAPNGVFPIILDSYISNLISRNIMGAGDDDRPLYLISELVFGGQSGSPVYNKNGEVIGVIFMNLNNSYGPIYGTAAIPLPDIIEFLQDNGVEI